MPQIEFKNLSFAYQKNRKNDEVEVFNDFSVIFPSDSFNVIVGESGCGKTTLLRLITGFIEDYSGDIFIDGKNTDDLSVKERNLAYINQNYVLYPNLTVFDNIAFPLKALGVGKDEIISRVFEVAEKLNLTPTLSRKPKYLSGGQKQRVALARGLIKNAKIYLFDEPLSNMEQSKRVEQRKMIKEFIKKYNSTAIYVTHDFTEAMALADNLFVMEKGKIVASGNPQDVYYSGISIVNDFIKATYFDIKYENENK